MTKKDQNVMRLARLTRRRLAQEEERGSALIATLIFMILLASLTTIMAATLLAQNVPAALAAKGTRTVYAAESGMQATLGILRSAAAAPDASGKVYGDKAALPCAVNATVDGDAAAARYEVTVRYFDLDPAGRDDDWLTANKAICTPGIGVASQPKYALIVSKGVDKAVNGQSASFGERALSAVYQFDVTNVNIPGGYIYARGGATCLTAEGKEPGKLIKYAAAASCTNIDTQYWIYDTDYRIKLASSTLAGSPYGPLCITGPATGLTSAEKTEKVTLQKCHGASDPARWNQLWSYEGGDRFRGQQNPIAKGNSGACLFSGATSGTPNNASYLWVGVGPGSDGPPADTGRLKYCASADAWGSFTPQAAVGAGAASSGTHQVVNYKEFGRCLDVTDEQVGKEFMISYPCKQDPTGTLAFLKWNHKWYYQEPDPGATSKPGQQIYINDAGGAKKCFQAPTATGGNPVFVTCSATDARQKWTRVGKTSDYATSYLFLDNQNRCLAVNPDDTYKTFSKIVVKVCDGTSWQKWNAPANAEGSQFGGYRELGG